MTDIKLKRLDQAVAETFRQVTMPALDQIAETMQERHGIDQAVVIELLFQLLAKTLAGNGWASAVRMHALVQRQVQRVEEERKATAN
jgi:hypothetical protein